MKKLHSVAYYVWLTIFSAIGLIASFWQTAEKIHGLKNPDLALSCNINPIVDCGAVLGHPLSSVMGVPNSMIGMIIFTALLVIGVLLWAGVRLVPRTQILLLAIVALLAGFSIWFYMVSLYIIGKICIFCIFIWLSSVPLFVLTVGQYGGALVKKSRADFVSANARRIIVSVYVLGGLLFLWRFREYYFG